MTERITVTYEIQAPPEGWEFDCVRGANPGELYWDGCKWSLYYLQLNIGMIAPTAVSKQQLGPATQADVGRTDSSFRFCPNCDWMTVHGS